MGRWQLLLKIVNRPVPRFLFGLWAFVSAYDVALSQFIPTELAQDAPKAWQVLALAEPLLPQWPFWAWLLILAALFAIVCFEYVFHTMKRNTSSSQNKVYLRPAPPSPHMGPEALGALGLRPQKYALPQEATQLNISAVTNRQLGALFLTLSQEVGEMTMRMMRSHSDQEQVAYFNAKYAARFFWLYGQARDRGFRDGQLDQYFERPETLKNPSHLNQQLRALGNRLPLYADR